MLQLFKYFLEILDFLLNIFRCRNVWLLIFRFMGSAFKFIRGINPMTTLFVSLDYSYTIIVLCYAYLLKSSVISYILCSFTSIRFGLPCDVKLTLILELFLLSSSIIVSLTLVVYLIRSFRIFSLLNLLSALLQKFISSNVFSVIFDQTSKLLIMVLYIKFYLVLKFFHIRGIEFMLLIALLVSTFLYFLASSKIPFRDICSSRYL